MVLLTFVWKCFQDRNFHGVVVGLYEQSIESWVGLIHGTTSIKYKVERDERYLPYIELGRWLCSHFQLETPLNFRKPITQKLYNLEK